MTAIVGQRLQDLTTEPVGGSAPVGGGSCDVLDRWRLWLSPPTGCQAIQRGPLVWFVENILICRIEVVRPCLPGVVDLPPRTPTPISAEQGVPVVIWAKRTADRAYRVPGTAISPNAAIARVRHRCVASPGACH